jgi:hypothetical protein
MVQHLDFVFIDGFHVFLKFDFPEDGFVEYNAYYKQQQTEAKETKDQGRFFGENAPIKAFGHREGFFK